MGFDIYRIQPLEDNRFALHRVGPLPLGGAEGLFAAYLPALAGDDAQWELAPAELLRWAGVESPETHGVFFDLTPRSKSQVNLMELVHVSGRTVSLLTDVVFQFKVACGSTQPDSIRGASGEWIVPGWQEKPNRFEHLRMEGGTRGGNWAWAEPPQSASATVL